MSRDIKFVTERQFLRARKLIRKLFYRRTMGKPSWQHGYLNPGEGYDTQSLLDIEGTRMLRIDIENFHINENTISEIKALEEFEEQDDIDVSDDGFRIYLNPNEEVYQDDS